MNREQILNIVKEKTLQILDECPPEDFDERKTLVELGADSLDMVEILSACTRELRIKIPRTKIADLKNIANFVDLLCEIKNRSETELR